MGSVTITSNGSLKISALLKVSFAIKVAGKGSSNTISEAKPRLGGRKMISVVVTSRNSDAVSNSTEYSGTQSPT